jgi:hypothetical protein
MDKKRSPRNRTTVLTEEDRALYAPRLCTASHTLGRDDIVNRTYNSELLESIDFFSVRECRSHDNRSAV